MASKCEEKSKEKKTSSDVFLLLTEAGIKLHFREEAVATACTYYHAFCSSMTEDDYDTHLVVMAALSLASKVQEHSVKLGDIVNTCYRCLNKGGAPLEVGDLYWQLKESVGKYELLLLRAMKFNFHLKLPHPYLLHYLLALSRWVDHEVWMKSHVTRVAWALLQDSFHLDLPTQQEPPHVIATAVLYLAIHCCKLSIPGSDPHGRRGSEGEAPQRQWWEVFSPGCSETKLQELAAKIMECITTANSKES